MVYNISAGFLQSYINLFSKKELSIEDMFKMLSVQMGGDGSKITKEQLDNYIKNVESKKSEISKQRLSALKQIQDNWDTIAKGKDYVSADDFKNFPTLLAAALMDSFTYEETPSAASNENIYDLLLESLGVKDINEVENTDLNKYLNTLLSNDANDDAISDAIDSIINIIAEREIASSITFEA